MSKRHCNGRDNLHIGINGIGSSFTHRATAVIIFLFFATGTSLFAFDGKGPRSGRIPLDGSGQMRVSPEDRCPVCGMKVIRYPKFASAIQLQDNTTYYFCSTGCMIRSWLHPEIYIASKINTLKRPAVIEYFTGQHVDARDIIFVFGSDIIGPMGPALVPVMDENYLKAFKNRHGGKSEFLLNNLNDNTWLELTGKKMVK